MISAATKKVLKSRLSSIRLRQASTLVIADHANGSVSPGTLAAITAATQLGNQEITALVCGSETDSIAQEIAKVDGVTKVLQMSAPKFSNWMAEDITEAIKSVQEKEKFSHIVSATTKRGQNYLGRLGAALDVSPIADVLKVVDGQTFLRPMYAGNAVAQVTSQDPVKVVSVRPTAFDPATTGDSPAPVESFEPAADTGLSTTFVSEDVSQSDRPDLGSAKVVVAGGRALKDAETFGMMYELADKLGGAVGASRAAVDAGMCPNELQIGQTGKVVAPDLYIAVGISGAIQHLAGMTDSKVIVAINKDKEAPIFQVADYGLVGDLFKIVPELKEKL
mmetsp:Transcript_30221/g.39841  ORF Transcript_30221/g.39841 Transcript_30221/m.39841 type:complete len:335 (-) Transcript_30221:478-1482(-)|eukprot:CAMPEP_0117744540 /NCGR_PEP_ID=MMETSP0947-20121206/6820_1 /TAXON_ID=44440 /ORGANISM="Chattonella subsalsa, Strain CCMP2191" /LENGTH=334 /DNA_ID=CAMNT_0005561509 /DNA_START=118 /DNA_END=1122 /DNA_ORIENTATION=-